MDIYVVVGEWIFWIVLKVMDNVGIWDFWLELRVFDGFWIGFGDYMFCYVVEDWYGNKVECWFFVSVKILGNYIILYYL